MITALLIGSFVGLVCAIGALAAGMSVLAAFAWYSGVGIAVTLLLLAVTALLCRQKRFKLKAA